MLRFLQSIFSGNESRGSIQNHSWKRPSSGPWTPPTVAAGVSATGKSCGRRFCGLSITWWPRGRAAPALEPTLPLQRRPLLKTFFMSTADMRKVLAATGAWRNSCGARARCDRVTACWHGKERGGDDRRRSRW